jgi:hypothetical protein
MRRTALCEKSSTHAMFLASFSFGCDSFVAPAPRNATASSTWATHNAMPIPENLHINQAPGYDYPSQNNICRAHLVARLLYQLSSILNTSNV